MGFDLVRFVVWLLICLRLAAAFVVLCGFSIVVRPSWFAGCGCGLWFLACLWLVLVLVVLVWIV